MANNESPLPSDSFSIERRKLVDNPGALSRRSLVDTSDFYGNVHTWVVETFRDDDGEIVAFLQRSSAVSALREQLPAAVVRALVTHREDLQAAARRRQGHRLIALRKGRGDKLGNPEALAAARAAGKRGKRRKRGRS